MYTSGGRGSSGGRGCGGGRLMGGGELGLGLILALFSGDELIMFSWRGINNGGRSWGSMLMLWLFGFWNLPANGK